MNLSVVMAMLRRHVMAVTGLLLIAGILGYQILHANPGYQDSGTIAFTAPNSWGPKNEFEDMQSLLSDEEITGWFVEGDSGQREVREAGGVCSYTVTFFNAYNEEYPDYSQPYMTVTTSSSDPTAAQTTFTAVVKVIKSNLEKRQADVGVSLGNQAQALLAAGPSGPLPQKGSRIRTLFSYGFLVLTCGYAVVSFLDRRKVRFKLRSKKWRYQPTSTMPQ